jgi:FkbM family methyltransferase
VHYKANLISNLVENIYKKQGSITIVQIGAHNGNTPNDPIHKFIVKHCSADKNLYANNIFILLVEPVKHIFKQLSENHKNFDGVFLENSAIAETSGQKNFYMLKDNINLAKFDMPEWLDQLGSLLPERVGKLWDRYEGNLIYQKFLRENMVVEKVRCITFHELLNKYDIKEIDFLQIDAEGYDYRILRSINFNEIRPKFINYERVLLQKKESACRNLMMHHNYKIHDHGQNSLCTLNSNLSGFYRFRNRAYNIWL